MTRYRCYSVVFHAPGRFSRMNMRIASATISVVIPARNEEVLIAATVDSVVRARDFWIETDDEGSAVEILVVDNASTDRTRDELGRHARSGVVRIATCDRLGSAHARNFGARLAGGEILVFLDADTHLPREALLRIATLCGTHQYEAGITGLGQLDGGRAAGCWWAFWNLVRRLPLARAKAMPACMFCTREVFDEFGPFDERVAIGEEWPILAGLYRARRHRLIYDRSLTALSSSRRMELQPFGYCRTVAKYAWAILSFRGRVHYSDQVRHARASETPRGVR